MRKCLGFESSLCSAELPDGKTARAFAVQHKRWPPLRVKGWVLTLRQ
jgi:hypothetical protein